MDKVWKLTISDRISETTRFKYEFEQYDELMSFLIRNEHHNTERCKYTITHDDLEPLPFDDLC